MDLLVGDVGLVRRRDDMDDHRDREHVGQPRRARREPRRLDDPALIRISPAPPPPHENDNP